MHTHTHSKALIFVTVLACFFGLAGKRVKAKDDSLSKPPKQVSIPAKIHTALAKLPKEIQPEELRRAKNGAIYVLLPNGAELIVLEKRTAPVAAVQAWVRSGAIHEQEWMGAGLSHFCEHLLFKGTTKRPVGVIDQEIRSAGGDDNAYTNSERTVYHVTTESSGFATGFDVLADMIMNATFPAEEVVKEHAVVVKEIERALDNPNRALWEAFGRLMFQVHPYHVPVLGYPDRFQRVTRKEVYAYYQRRYTPQLVTFIAVGDFDAAEVIPLMARTVGTWKRKSVSTPMVAAEPPQVAPREVVVSHPLCQKPRFMLGFPTVSLRHPDLYALDVLASILGDGRSSRLYRQVKDQAQLALEIEAYSYTPMYTGEFTVSVTAEADKVLRAKRLILLLLEQAREKKPSKEELIRAKRKVRVAHVFGKMTAEEIAGNLGSDWFVAGDLDFSQTYVEGIEAVTAKEVLRVAQQYLNPKRLNFALLLPPKVVLAQPSSVVKPVTKAKENVANKKEQKEPWKSYRTRQLGGAAVTEITLANGLRIVVREDHSLPAVHASFAMLGGQRNVSDAMAGAGNLLAEMLDRGTSKFTKQQIAEEVEDLGATLSTFGGRNTIGIEMRALTEDFSTVFSLGVECLVNPSFPSLELEKLRKGVLAQIDQQDESLWSMMSKVFRPLMYASHPYGRQLKGTKESVTRLSASDLRTLHGQWLRMDNLVLSFCGDLTPKQAVEMVQKTFKNFPLKANSTTEAKRSLKGLVKSVEGEKQKKGIKGLVLQLGFRGVELGHPDKEGLELVAGLLTGLGGRLNTVIREEQGMAYSVGVYNDTQLDGGAIVFYVRTDPKKLEPCMKGMWGEIEKLRETLVPVKELESVKNHLAGKEAIGLQDQSALCLRLALTTLYKEGLETIFSKRERLKKITPLMLQQLAKKYLLKKQWVKAIVRPE